MPARIEFTAIVPKKKVSAARQADVVSLMRKMGNRTRRRLMRYPTNAPPGSTYVRTGDLGREWAIRGPGRQGLDLVVEVGNSMSYAILVQGPADGPKGERQTALHAQTGWPRVDEVGEEEWERVRPEIVKALQKKP